MEAYLEAVKLYGGMDEVERRMDDVSEDVYNGRVLLRGKTHFNEFLDEGEINTFVAAVE